MAARKGSPLNVVSCTVFASCLFTNPVDQGWNASGQGDQNSNEQKGVKPTAVDLRGAIAAIDVSKVEADRGRNLGHYLVHPCGWQNVQLLQQLVKVYKSKLTSLLTTADKNGVTPITLAASTNQHAIYQAMMKAIGKERSGQSKRMSLTIEIPPPTQLPLNEDYEKFIKEWNKNEMKASKNQGKQVKPAWRSGYEETGEIVECPETKQRMRVTLNKSDVRVGLYGYHNYYQMELIKRKDANLYILFTSWGRIGDSGQHQLTPFDSIEAAIKEFKSVFKQKTGNEWRSLDKFAAIEGKYRLTIMDSSARSFTEIELSDFDLSGENEKDEVIQFVADIANVTAMRMYARSVKKNKMSSPFGRITKEDIEAARNILNELALLVQQKESAQDERPINMDKIVRLSDMTYDLTSSFFTRLPIGGFDCAPIAPINCKQSLANAHKILDSLGQIEIAGRMQCAARYALNNSGMDPFKYIKDVLDCPISPLSPTSEVTQRVLQWIQLSSPNTKVQSIFAVNPRRAAISMQKHAECSNITYLFHGTRAENVLSILHYGLKPTPVDALPCGQIHGSGVYLADACKKSSAYCTASMRGVKYMLVCKVALGKVVGKSNSANDFDTLKIEGRQRMVASMTIDGALMPLAFSGSPRDDNLWSQKKWTEYIVKDESRILPVMVIAFTEK